MRCVGFLRVAASFALMGGVTLVLAGSALADSATSVTPDVSGSTSNTIAVSQTSSVITASSLTVATSEHTQAGSLSADIVPLPANNSSNETVSHQVPENQATVDTPKAAVPTTGSDLTPTATVSITPIDIPQPPMVPTVALVQPVTGKHVPVKKEHLVARAHAQSSYALMINSFADSSVMLINSLAMSEPQPIRTTPTPAPIVPFGEFGTLLSIFAGALPSKYYPVGNEGNISIFAVELLASLVYVAVGTKLSASLILSFGAWLKRNRFAMVSRSDLPQLFSHVWTSKLLGYVSVPAPFS